MTYKIGEAVTSSAKKQQSIGIKSYYSNTSNGFEYKKKLHKKTRVRKTYAYRMLPSFKTSVNYKEKLSSGRTEPCPLFSSFRRT